MSAVVVQAERAFRAMGSDAHVLVWSGPECPVAPEDLLEVAVTEVERLEARWSRFRPDSDISRLNAAGGRPVAIAPETAALLDRCRTAWARTHGRFDPMVLPALLAAGYDRTFESLAPTGAVARPAPPPARPSIERDLVLDLAAGTARLEPGAAIDVGGIGKGHAADLVAATLVGLGAAAVCVNLGGDLRTVGPVPGGSGLLVAIEDPLGGDDLAIWSVHDAAVATSSCLRRRWERDGEDRHHLIDPATGRPARTDVVACSVVAPTGAWADALAKAVLLAPPAEAAEILAELGAAALVTHAGGRTSSLGTPPVVSGPGMT